MYVVCSVMLKKVNENSTQRNTPLNVLAARCQERKTVED